MAKTPSNLLVSALDRTAFVKITGRANFTLSVNFKTLLAELREHGYLSYVLDLSECMTMDSTFLGVLAGFAIKLADDPNQSVPSHCLQLLNPNQRVIDLLENLGIAHLFQIVHGTNPAEATLRPTPQTEKDPTREELSQTCLEAHQTLMAVNPDNIPKFKDVAQFLAEDLKKSKQ